MRRMISVFKDSDMLEKIIGGVFGIVSLGAIIFEMALGDFDKGAIVGGVKDIAGTLITIVMLFVAIKALSPQKKKQSGFTDVFIEEMEALIYKYDPILSFYGEEMKDGKMTLRYNIANKLDAVATNDPGGNHKLFRIAQGEDKIEFSVSETVFPQIKNEVAAVIAGRIARCNGAVVKDVKPTKEGFSLLLAEPLENARDAVAVAALIDHVVLLYIAEYRRK